MASIVHVVLGAIGISAACGLRAFLPLLALGLAARAGIVELPEGSRWLAADAALWSLGGAALLEILADKIPAVDHTLDAIGLTLRPLAGALGAFALLRPLATPWAQIAALVFGAGTLAVQTAKAKVRLGSTAVTLGHANPLISLAEDMGALALAAAAILIPAAILLVVAPVAVALTWRRGHGRGLAGSR